MNVYISMFFFGVALGASITAVGMTVDKKKAPARSHTSDKRSPKRDSPQAVPILSESEGKCKA